MHALVYIIFNTVGRSTSIYDLCYRPPYCPCHSFGVYHKQTNKHSQLYRYITYIIIILWTYFHSCPHCSHLHRHMYSFLHPGSIHSYIYDYSLKREHKINMYGLYIGARLKY